MLQGILVLRPDTYMGPHKLQRGSFTAGYGGGGAHATIYRETKGKQGGSYGRTTSAVVRRQSGDHGDGVPPRREGRIDKISSIG